MKERARMYVSVATLIIGLICSEQGYALLDIQGYGFSSITNNNMDDAWIGHQQLSVWVSDQGMMDEDGQSYNLVGFKFMNTGTEACVISEIYFQGGMLLEYVSINEDIAYVDFEEIEVGNVSPGNLPGGKSIVPQFIADSAFSIEPANPAPKWGVGPGEYVEVVYAIEPLSSFMDVVNELNQGHMRIGIHVQAFDSGGSESFINIPEPTTLILLGLGSIALCKRRT